MCYPPQQRTPAQLAQVTLFVGQLCISLLVLAMFVCGQSDGKLP